MSGIKGNVQKLSKISNFLQGLKRTVAINVASAIADDLTIKLRAAFDAGQTARRAARPLGVNGNALTLRGATGATAGSLDFTAIGTRVRAVMGTRYGRYLIGKYEVFPMGAIPVEWQQAIADAAAKEIELQRRLAG